MSRRRILVGVGANLYGQVVIAAIQLATVPGFLHAWGADRFGLWLTLSAATAALSLADGGMTITSGTAMTVAVSRGSLDEAGRLFARSARFGAAGTLLLGAGLVAFCSRDPGHLLGRLSVAPADSVPFCIVALGGVSLLGLLLGVVDAGFRANGDYAMGLTAVSTIRLCEGAAALGIALSGGGLAAAALAQVSTRALGLLAMSLVLRRRAAWVTLIGADLSRASLVAALPPAVAALAIPAAFATSLQGMTLVAGLVATSGTVAVFVAVRTLTRLLVQALGLVNHALMPEMSIASGRGDGATMRTLLRLNFGVALLTLGPGWIVMVVAGPAFLSHWTGGAMEAGRGFFAVLASAAFLHGIWLSSANLLLALNRQAYYAYRFLGVAGLTCGAGAVLGHVMGLPGLAWAALGGEATMVLAVLPAQLRTAFGRDDAFVRYRVRA